jgi:DNA-binding beta-propeller fold protein YncE
VREVARLPHPLRYAAVATVGARLLVAGGTDGTKARTEILSVDPLAHRVRVIAHLPAPLAHAAGAALGGRFFVIGGRGDAPNAQRRAIWAIDPKAPALRLAGRLPVGLSDLAAVTHGAEVVVVGGRDARGRVHDEVLRLRASASATAPSAVTAGLRPGKIPALVDRHDVYAAARAGLVAPVARGDPSRVYVPNSQSNTVDVVDQGTGRIVGHFAVGRLPQHVTPSWDLRTLWVTNDMSNSLTPVDPRTGHPGRPVPVTDPYNLYFTTNGKYAIVVAEARQRLDFRDPHTFQLVKSLPVPCRGVDHMDYTADGSLALASCEFSGQMIVVDLVRQSIRMTINLPSLGATPRPQDVKLSPDGKTFFVADMNSNGLWELDARTFRIEGFLATGAGTHGLYPSRDARYLYATNRAAGTISVIDFATRRIVHTWSIPGGSPDMGGVSADGKTLWLSGRYSDAVYAISTIDGRLIATIHVGSGPHGLCVWPQPGRYSIGHTGITR